jgi:hypothetical protein
MDVRDIDRRVGRNPDNCATKVAVAAVIVVPLVVVSNVIVTLPLPTFSPFEIGGFSLAGDDAAHAEDAACGLEPADAARRDEETKCDGENGETLHQVNSFGKASVRYCAPRSLRREAERYRFREPVPLFFSRSLRAPQ